MLEDFINALNNFKQNKVRTLLSLLGVIIGVTSVIIITGIGKSATENVTASFGNSGLDLVQVNSGFGRRTRNVTLTMDEAFRHEITTSIPDVKSVFYCNTISGTLRLGDTDATAQVSAVEPDFLEANNLTVKEGSLFQVTDFVDGRQTIILGSDIAEVLFPDGGGIGSTITLDTGSIKFGFKVAGILESCSAGMERPDQKAYVPRSFYRKKIEPNPDAGTMVIQVTNQDKSSAVSTAVKEFTTAKTGSEYAVNVMSMQTILEQFNEITGTLSLLLSGIAAISLLVGGIGIMNIMIVTVTERRKEIGIRKALGASPRAIKQQFLVESAAITVTGGIIGIVAGIALSAIIVTVVGWTFTVQISACLLSFVFSAFVGVFFGLYPAIKASKLDPVAALSSE